MMVEVEQRVTELQEVLRTSESHCAVKFKEIASQIEVWKIKARIKILLNLFFQPWCKSSYYPVQFDLKLEMCSVSTNGERASQAIALTSSLFSLCTKWVCFSWKFDRPNPFGANLGTLFHSYTWRFYFLTEPKLTAHHVQVKYRLNFATISAQ